MAIGIGAGVLLVGIDAGVGWFYGVTIVLVAPVVMQGLYPGRGLLALHAGSVVARRGDPPIRGYREGEHRLATSLGSDSAGAESPRSLDSPHNARPGVVHKGRWLHNTESTLSREQVGDLLARLSEGLAGSGTIALGDREIAVPDIAHTVFRFERIPGGELCLRLELKWEDEHAGHTSNQPAATEAPAAAHESLEDRSEADPLAPEEGPLPSQLSQRAQEISAGALAETMLPGYVPRDAESNLEPAQLKDLWHRYKDDGDPSARERLLLGYSPLVKYVAGRISRGLPFHVEEADLVSYGLLGLISAIERFEPMGGIRFETFATTRIKGTIVDELRSRDWVPRSVLTKAREIVETNARLADELDRVPTEHEMAEALGVSIDGFQDSLMRISSSSVAALDELWMVSDTLGDEGARLDTIQAAVDPAHEMDRTDLKRRLEDAIARLPDREKLVVALYYYENLTLREIGEVLGVTESRVSQLHTKAVLRLKSRLT